MEMFSCGEVIIRWALLAMLAGLGVFVVLAMFAFIHSGNIDREIVQVLRDSHWD